MTPDQLAWWKHKFQSLEVYDNWRQVSWDSWRWPNFSPRELACKGTSKLAYDPDTMDKFQALRNELGKPVSFNSFYRSPEHNEHVGGSEYSMHQLGIAGDVDLFGHNKQQLLKAAKKVGFMGIGEYNTFTHLDDRPWPARWNG